MSVICPVCEGEGIKVDHVLDDACREGIHNHCRSLGQCTSCMGTGMYDDDMDDDD